MKYQLQKDVLGSPTRIELRAEEYERLGSARAILTNAFALEEKFDIVVSNYLEFEKELLAATADNMVRHRLGYSDFFGLRSALNIRVVNLLTSTKLYLDQISQHLRLCVPHDASATRTITELCHHEYDSNFAYRFMEALRNHVQHRGIAVHHTTDGSRWTSLDEDGGLEFTVSIAAQRRSFEDDEKFKRSVLREMPERVDLVEVVRRYVESISVIHEKARELVNGPASKSRSLIENQHTRFSALEPGKTRGLVAVALKEEKRTGYIPLLLDWDDVRLELQRKNPSLVNLHKRYVTSEVRREGKGGSARA